MQPSEGQRITTRYYGGLEAVIVRQVHDDYLIVARMGGAAKELDGITEATDVLPTDEIEKLFDRDGSVLIDNSRKDGLHPALLK